MPDIVLCYELVSYQVWLQSSMDQPFLLHSCQIYLIENLIEDLTFNCLKEQWNRRKNVLPLESIGCLLGKHPSLDEADRFILYSNLRMNLKIWLYFI